VTATLIILICAAMIIAAVIDMAKAYQRRNGDE
jgi:hypothetical protein